MWRSLRKVAVMSTVPCHYQIVARWLVRNRSTRCWTQLHWPLLYHVPVLLCRAQHLPATIFRQHSQSRKQVSISWFMCMHYCITSFPLVLCHHQFIDGKGIRPIKSLCHLSPVILVQTTTAASILRPFFQTTWVSRHQKGKPFWILLELEMMGWQWHQLDHMQSFAPRFRQITMQVPHPLGFYRPGALPAAQQQRQSTEGMWF